MINSKQKGKTGELELAHKFTLLGLKARRSQQFKGTGESADVVFDDPALNNVLHIECKRDEHLNVEKALQQAEHDHTFGQIPIVCHRKNNEEWKVTLRFEEFIDLFKAAFTISDIIRPTSNP